MIPRKAVKKFLARPRKDYREYKRLTSAELQRRIDALPVKPPHWHSLSRVQKLCFVIGVETLRFAYFLDMGMGKTFLATALARYTKKAGGPRRYLMLLPNRANKPDIVAGIKRHSSKTSVTLLEGSSTHKWEQIAGSDALLTLETYAGLAHMVSTPVPAKKGDKMRLKPDRKLIKKLLATFDGLIADECTFLGNRDTLPFRICRAMSNRDDTAVFLLSGTPFGRDPLPLWAMMFLVDRGHTLGETLGLFRAAFYNTTQNYWGGYEHEFIKKNEGLLHRYLAAASIRFEADKKDLPERVPVISKCKLPHDVVDYADQAKQAIVAAHGNYQEMKNAFMRMRQISSGFLGYKDDETGERAQYVFPKNAKLELLLDWLTNNIREREKVVVFHEFKASGRMMQAALKQHSIGNVMLNGDTKDPDVAIARFVSDKACPVFLLNNSAGAYGLDRLKIARYGVYYESPVSPVVRQQTERRLVRQFSTHKSVTLIDLVVLGTYDQRILDFHAEGKGLFAAIVDGRAKP